MKKINEETFLRRIVDISLLASKDETRSHLCGVYIRIDNTKENKISIIATDGFRMIEEKYIFEGVSFEDYNMKGFLIENQEVKIIKAVLKEYKNSSYSIKFHGETFTINNKYTFIVNTNIVYPNIARIYNNTTTDFLEVGLNAKYLLEIAKAIKEDDKTYHIKMSIPIEKVQNKETKEVSIEQKNNPYIISNQKTKHKAILMPLRLNQ